MKAALVTLPVLLSVLFSGIVSTPKCGQQSMYRSLEVTCVDIPGSGEWKEINNSTTHVIFTCANNNNDNTLHKNQLHRFFKLKFFNVKSCPIFDLTKEYFKDLIYLENVVLDNLPLQRLRANLFKNSSNLIQLSLIRLQNLSQIHPRFMDHQNKLQKLHIIESNITAKDMKPILLSVYVTITDLYWCKNKQKLFFEQTYFRDLFLDNLKLEHNGIENTEFLSYVNAKSLSLKNNTISKFTGFKLPTLEGLESLNLAFNDLTGIFGEKNVDSTLPTVKELIISDNLFEGLAYSIDKILPKLEILDVRNNRLTTLPSVLHQMLTNKPGRILLTDNMFHCNCEMQWIMLSHPSLANTILCQTMATESGVKLSNVTLTKLYYSSELMCTLPQLQLQLYDQFKDTIYSVRTTDNGMKVYSVVLRRGEVLNWQCIGVGDPAPRLKWISNGQTLKVKKSPQRRFEIRTVMKNLVVEKESGPSTYICRGSNTAGDTSIELRLVNEDHEAQLAKMVLVTTKGVICQRAAKLMHMMVIFLYILQQ